jgi:hypothetical protein
MTTDTREAIREEFDVHVLNHDGIQKARDIASCFSILLNDTEAICGKEGREMALVRTHLQQAAFFAKRAMAVRPENQLAAPVQELPPARFATESEMKAKASE